MQEPARPASPFDPVYYGTRDLDVYPTPLAPLRLDYPKHLEHTPVAGRVRATLLVSESGAVDHVAVLSAEPAGHFEEHARAALASTGFHPGRKGGRAVRSRLTVSVEYDPAARAGVSR
jgi:TonB family protein